MGFTAFLLVTVLISEAGNSLLNPAEAMVLAHQPISGATYTAAKLSHLLSIVLYLVPGINLVPALAGSDVEGCSLVLPVPSPRRRVRRGARERAVLLCAVRL